MGATEKDPTRGLNAAVAATLNGERVASGLTFDALAERSGINKRQLIRMLSAQERHIDVANLAAISNALGVSPGYVVRLATERLERTAENHEQGDVLAHRIEEQIRAHDPLPPRTPHRRQTGT